MKHETSTKNSEEPTVDDTTAEAIAKELTEFTTESQTEMSTQKLDDSNEHETTSSIVIDHDSNENIDNGDKFVDDEYKYAGGYDYNGGKSRILVISWWAWHCSCLIR